MEQKEIKKPKIIYRIWDWKKHKWIKKQEPIIESNKPKQPSKFKRWISAIKNMSPERMLSNKFYAQIGVCIGMLGALTILIYARVWWALCFMPFIFFIQLLDLLATYQQIKQMKTIKEMMKGGAKDVVH